MTVCAHERTHAGRAAPQNVFACILVCVILWIITGFKKGHEAQTNISHIFASLWGGGGASRVESKKHI